MSEDLKNEQQAADEKETLENKAAAEQSADTISTEGLSEAELQEVEELLSQVTELEKDVARAESDRDNMIRRTEEARIRSFVDAKIEAIKDYLPIYDDLVRSLQAAEQVEVDQKFLEKVKAVSDNFYTVLEKYKVERIDQINVPFDVDIHDAMMRQPVADESIESNTVIMVYEPGYKLGERVIKHAKVIVSQ